MSREIKFRGKDMTTDEWQYGCLVNNLWGYAPHHSLAGQSVCEIIVCDTCDDYSDMQDKELNKTVDPKTVGQFTGLLDKNGKEIYEGDILLNQYEDKMEDPTTVKIYYPVVFKDGCFGWIGENSGEFYPFCTNPIPQTIVVGNIYEYPHLLKQNQ